MQVHVLNLARIICMSYSYDMITRDMTGIYARLLRVCSTCQWRGLCVYILVIYISNHVVTDIFYTPVQEVIIDSNL